MGPEHIGLGGPDSLRARPTATEVLYPEVVSLRGAVLHRGCSEMGLETDHKLTAGTRWGRLSKDEAPAAERPALPSPVSQNALTSSALRLPQ